MAEFDPSLSQGEVLTNEELSRVFKCSVYGGMRRSHRTNSLVLVSKESGGTYSDRWEGDVFHYTGMGLLGDQKLGAGQNRTLAESDTNGVAVFLFENPAPNKYFFVGRVALASGPYSETQRDLDGNERTVWVFPVRVAEQATSADVLKLKCPFEEDFGDLRPRASEELLGVTVELEDLETGQSVSRTIVRERPDPAAGTVTLESPIGKGLARAGGLAATPGTVITVHGRPMYRLVGFGSSAGSSRPQTSAELNRAYRGPADAPCGWSGTVSEFLRLDQASLLDVLHDRHLKVMGMQPDRGQVDAWRGEYRILQPVLSELVLLTPRSARWAVVFEYELPRERGRRPDVVILTGSQVLVLEFKESGLLQRAHVDQVAAYARDLSEYHAASHNKLIDPVLVLSRSEEQWRTVDEVTVVNPAGLRKAIADLERRAPDRAGERRSVDQRRTTRPCLRWSLPRADIFEHEPLPQIRKAQSAGIPDTISRLVAAAKRAREAQELHLALVTGVPGSGKTLVGLQFVYDNYFGGTGSERSAVFLSGNGPLVKVLQYALRNRIFVQDVHGFLKDYGGASNRIPQEDVWVYDEAQRAWDANQVFEKRHLNLSEPEDFLLIGSGSKSWALMVGLIGEGQEIHVGEEAGISHSGQRHSEHGQSVDSALSGEASRHVHRCQPG